MATTQALPPYNPELEARYDSKNPFHTLFRLLATSPWEHFRLLILYFLKMVPQLISPLVIAESIRVAADPTPINQAYLWYFYGFFFVTLFANVPLHVWFIRGTSKITRSMELRLRASLVRRLQQLSMSFHGERESGRIQAKVLRDVEEIVRLVEIYFQATMGAVIGVIFALVYTLREEPLVALAYLVAAPLALFIIRIFRGAMRRRNDELRRQVETMSQRVNEMIDLVPVTRAHGLEDFEISSVGHYLEEVRERGKRVDSINAVFGSCTYVVFHTASVAVVVITTLIVLQDNLTVDKIALYASLFGMVIGSIQQILGLAPQISKSLSSVRSIGEILECPDMEENEGKDKVPRVEGEIDFRAVTFTYPGKEEPAVTDFSLKVPKGTCVAFVGESGSGKSTLMQLTIGFLRPQLGRIYLDGKSMADIDMRSWRRHVAMVPQQTILFSGSIRDNITYGLDHFSEETIWQAIDAANLRKVIEELPKGLDTKVGENGLKLSGGQRQRLAIARAIVRDPSVIILDEATSALDVISEKEVQTAIDRLIHGRTTFIVAHRLSTIRNADIVVVMDHGRCVEIGPPAELEARQGAFYRLKSLQT